MGENLWPQQGHSWVWVENGEVFNPSVKLRLFCSGRKGRRLLRSRPQFCRRTDCVLRERDVPGLSADVQACVPEAFVSAPVADSVERASHLAGCSSCGIRQLLSKGGAK